MLRSVLNKDLCLFWVSSSHCFASQQSPGWLTVALRRAVIYGCFALIIHQPSAAAFSCHRTLQRGEHREPRITCSSENIRLSAKVYPKETKWLEIRKWGTIQVPSGINVNELKRLQLSVLGQNLLLVFHLFFFCWWCFSSKVLSADYRSGGVHGRGAAYHSFHVTAAITGLLCANYRLIIRTLNWLGLNNNSFSSVWSITGCRQRLITKVGMTEVVPVSVKRDC